MHKLQKNLVHLQNSRVERKIDEEDKKREENGIAVLDSIN